MRRICAAIFLAGCLIYICFGSVILAPWARPQQPDDLGPLPMPSIIPESQPTWNIPELAMPLVTHTATQPAAAPDSDGHFEQTRLLQQRYGHLRRQAASPQRRAELEKLITDIKRSIEPGALLAPQRIQLLSACEALLADSSQQQQLQR